MVLGLFVSEHIGLVLNSSENQHLGFVLVSGKLCTFPPYTLISSWFNCLTRSQM